jgi:hypothetical protein
MHNFAHIESKASSSPYTRPQGAWSTSLSHNLKTAQKRLFDCLPEL